MQTIAALGVHVVSCYLWFLKYQIPFRYTKIKLIVHVKKIEAYSNNIRYITSCFSSFCPLNLLIVIERLFNTFDVPNILNYKKKLSDFLLSIPFCLHGLFLEQFPGESTKDMHGLMKSVFANHIPLLLSSTCLFVIGQLKTSHLQDSQGQ